jgi:ankyrin repeat protein
MSTPPKFDVESSLQQQQVSEQKIQWSDLSDDKQKEIQKEVLEATIRGDIAKCKVRLQQYEGFRFDYCVYDNDHGDTLLHLAALHGHLQIVKYLIVNGYYQSECRNRYKNTPLHRAAREGQFSVVKFLIEEQNCDRMCICNWGRTPLHIACKHSKLEVVKYLTNLEKIDLNAKDRRHNSTPLDLAAKDGSVDVVKYMIDNTGCYDPANYIGINTPLHLAAYKGNLPVVQCLVGSRRFDVNVNGAQNRTPLHSACHGGQLKVVKFLMETEKVNQSVYDYEQGLTPLDVAAEYGTLALVQYMVEKRNWQLQFSSENRYTQLHHAAYGGKQEIVEYFIKTKGYEPHCKGFKGRTPLHSACAGGKNGIVKYLISKFGVDPSCQDDDGNTPLHSAVKSGAVSIVELLITEFKCDPGKVNREGKDPAYYAEKRGETHILTCLKKQHHHDESKTKGTCDTKETKKDDVIKNREEPDGGVENTHSAETETNLPVDTNSPTRRKFDILSNDDHLPLTPNDEELKLEMEKIQPVVCAPEIPGADIIAQTKININPDQPLDFHWEGHGFEVHVPAGAIVSREGGPVTMCIQASLGGVYQLPDDDAHVSGVYWLSLHPHVKKFDKKVKLSLQHCASLCDDSALSFVTVKCTEPQPYKFKPIPGGSFLEPRFGSIELDHFSGVAINTDRKSISVEYYLCAHYIHKERTNVYEVHITVTKPLDLQQKEVKRKYKGTEEGPYASTMVNGDEISLVIPRDSNPPKKAWVNDDWVLTPLQNTTLKRRFLEAPGGLVPHFRIRLEPKSNTITKSLKQEISFTGVDEGTFLTISRDPRLEDLPLQGRGQTQPLDPTQQGTTLDVEPGSPTQSGAPTVAGLQPQSRSSSICSSITSSVEPSSSQSVAPGIAYSDKILYAQTDSVHI